ncbi:MAG: winged helix-turn-helix domain-containing protein [Chloroflexi bacterium]|nr:winged helix-turn-helix domain-containing protein [Chloroflexota bacterium]
MSDNAPALVDAAGREFTIKALTILGRAPNADVFIADRRASRHHAEIAWDGERAILRDCDSANGTLLNGARVVASRELRDGDQIEIASAVFSVRDPEATFRASDFPRVEIVGDEVWLNRQPLALSPKEQLLFNFLHHHAGDLVTKQQIAEAVWPEYAAQVFDYQIENIVKQLRERLEPDPRKPVLIVTVRGRGYKLIAK